MLTVALLTFFIAHDTPIERCRAESQALNTAKTIATCQAAANDAALDDTAHVEALKLLGMALMVESEEDLAEEAFKKMLALDPDATLGADAGPNVQRVLEAARVDLRAEQAKKLPEKKIETVKAPAPAAVVSPTVAWSLVGAGGAVALVSSVIVAGAVYDRYYNRVPCGPNADACIPFVPMLFGIYKPQDREKFAADSSAWIGGGIAAAGLGALGIGAGAFLLAGQTEP